MRQVVAHPALGVLLKEEPNRPVVFWVLAARMPRVAVGLRVARQAMAHPRRVAARRARAALRQAADRLQRVERQLVAAPKQAAARYQRVAASALAEQRRQRNVLRYRLMMPHPAAARH